MKHVTASVPGTALERVRAARDAAPLGRYSCPACLDTGLLYVSRTPYGRPALGVVPCTECDKGGSKHLDGNVCIWARGSRACPLCGSHEGEQVPSGWIPRAPVGWVTYDELPGWKGNL